MPAKWVIFDVGETLFSEERLFNDWADFLSVERSAFWSVLNEFIAAGEDHRHVFTTFNPEFQLASARASREAVGNPDALRPGDIYPDALPVIRALADRGVKVGVAGNQPAYTSDLIRSLDVPIELIGMSDEWNAKKPDPVFFERLIHLTGAAPEEIAYVGDRLDNDVLPARAMGMTAVFLVRGPWGRAHAEWPEAASVDLKIYDLESLPALLGL